jgi:hypothetical protein
MTGAGRGLLILVGALVLAACGSDQSGTGTNTARLGEPCDLGVADAGVPGTIATISSPDKVCASQICLFGPFDKASDTGPLCTAPCTSNLECETGTMRDATDPDDHRCRTGFMCMVPTTVGSFACQKMCVCTDWLNVPAGGFQTPVVCTN